jgi:TonB family protein
MRSLFQNELSEPQPVRHTAWLSIGAHAIVLALIAIGTFHVHRAIIFRPMTRGSVTNVSVVSVNRGALAAALAMKTPAAENTPPRPRPVPKPSPLPARSSAALKAPPAHQASGAQASAEKSNSGATGDGSDAQSMYPAYPVVSPSPQVRDRSLLPPTDQKVVVDVNLSAQGQVQQATLVSGLGNALDQVVLDTVRGWQFHPAMLNGGPVPSNMELVFPFNRNYPTAE